MQEPNITRFWRQLKSRPEQSQKQLRLEMTGTFASLQHPKKSLPWKCVIKSDVCLTDLCGHSCLRQSIFWRKTDYIDLKMLSHGQLSSLTQKALRCCLRRWCCVIMLLLHECSWCCPQRVIDTTSMLLLLSQGGCCYDPFYDIFSTESNSKGFQWLLGRFDQKEVSCVLSEAVILNGLKCCCLKNKLLLHDGVAFSCWYVKLLLSSSVLCCCFQPRLRYHYHSAERLKSGPQKFRSLLRLQPNCRSQLQPIAGNFCLFQIWAILGLFSGFLKQTILFKLNQFEKILLVSGTRIQTHDLSINSLLP